MLEKAIAEKLTLENENEQSNICACTKLNECTIAQHFTSADLQCHPQNNLHWIIGKTGIWSQLSLIADHNFQHTPTHTPTYTHCMYAFISHKHS